MFKSILKIRSACNNIPDILTFRQRTLQQGKHLQKVKVYKDLMNRISALTHFLHSSLPVNLRFYIKTLLEKHNIQAIRMILP